MATASKITKIGKYEVVDVIGRGGMGVVYKARDPYLDRLVAIKMMNIDIHESSDFLERFYREAKSTASLQHPNIVTVYDLGEYQDRPFLVMMYLEGHSLESLLRANHPLTLLDKINIIIDVCQGLAYAHQHGIIHRDIKPGNIMVLNDGSVKIVDFGIARLGDNTFTQTGQMVGSLHYMPPEQFLNKPLDRRADVYSTGVVLYQLLTYSLPFEGENPGSTIAKIIGEPPPLFRQFGLSYPPELEAITLKALAKDRNQRFATAEAMAMALTEVQDHFKQESIKEYLTKAELLQQSNELLQAQDYLLKVLKLDRQHTTAARLLSVVRTNLQAQVGAERARQLRQQAEEACGRNEFDAALVFLKQAIELDNNAELQTLLENIEKTKAVAELVRKAISRAEAAQRSGDLDSAKSAIDTAFSHRPDDSRVKALRRAIERDLGERERQRQVEGLLDEARKQMAGRRFTAALDLLKEAKELDPSAPQLRTLLERLATEHQQEKQRRELEGFNREVQEAIDRDDYKGASAKAAEALGRFPDEAGLARLKELADAQIEIAAQKEFVRNRTAAAQELLDSGQTQRAMDAVEKALRKVPGNARLESFRELIHNRMMVERTQADKATCLRQANEAISLARYTDAIQILKSAQVRFVDATELDALLRFCRDQQAKAQHQALVEEAIRAAQPLLAKQDFDGAVKLLQKAADQVPSEDLDILLQQAREQRDGFQRDLQAAIAKGKSLLKEGAIANAREFLSSRPVSYQQSVEFRDLIEEAQTIPIPALPIDSARAEATQMFGGVGAAPRTATEREVATTIFPRVEPESLPEEPSEPPQTKLATPWKRNPLVIGAVALAVVVVGLVIWRLISVKPTEAYLTIEVKSGTQALPGAHLLVDGKEAGRSASDGTMSANVTPGTRDLQVTLDGYKTWSDNLTVKAGERKPVVANMELMQPKPTEPIPQPTPVLGTLLVRSNVSGADIFIDGQQWKNPTGHDNKLKIQTVQLDPGNHRVQLKASGYQDSGEQTVEIVAKKEKSLPFELIEIKSQTHLMLESQPPGASVRIDDKAAGSTVRGKSLPATVPPGPHTVQFNLDGYDPKTVNITVKEGENQPVRIVLKPKTDAYLILQSQGGAEVRVDGDVRGTVGPVGALEVKVSPGSHQVQVSLNGYGTQSFSEAVVAGERKNLDAMLTKTPPPAETHTPTISFFANPATIEQGKKAKLSWETQYSTEVSIDGIGSALPSTGFVEVMPTETTEYTLIAKANGLSSRATARVVVQPKASPPPKPPSEDESRNEKPTAPSGGGFADIASIQQFVHTTFKEAYETESPIELRKVWPSPDKDTLNVFRSKSIKSMKITDDCSGDPVITDDKATLTCNETIRYVVDGPQITISPYTIVFHLKKQNGKWYVESRIRK